MKEIRSNFVKESLLDYETLANSLKENTSNAVRDLLSETVRNTYHQILNEEDDNEDEYEVEEVDDTKSDDINDADNKEDLTKDNEDSDDSNEDSLDIEDNEDVETDVDDDNDIEDTDDNVDVTSTEIDTSTLPSDDDSLDNGWAEFEKYKVSDDEYDLSQADDEDVIKVYKLLKDDDQVLVNVDNTTNKVELKDNETGAEYLLDLGSFKDSNKVFDDNVNDELNDDNMTESRLFEITLDEYDSHVGYTDNYQKRDVMTTPNMNEPGKNVNDWDAGVPKGKSKPWVGKGSSKPFDKTITEEDDEAVDEATNVGGFVQQNSTSKSHIPNSNGRKARNASVAGNKVTATSDPRYKTATNESKMLKKVNQILKENNELKKALGKFKTVLQEAAVTNVNLGQIIKLISENSTTKTEKQEIIARFGKEAKTVEQSKNLYETISRELKKNNTISIEEEKQFTTNGSQKINETQIYKSKDLLDSLDLMHRLCK